MTSEQQILANRSNAQKSTGPRTASGKRRSRRNALGHGLTAVTVIDTIEAAEDYRKFEKKINSDYEPKTAVEFALVTRLAALLWRLRRANACESGLLQIQAELLMEPEAQSLEVGNPKISDRNTCQTIGFDCQEPATLWFTTRRNAAHQNFQSTGPTVAPNCVKKHLARSFSRLTKSDSSIFERIGRYEASLWRQVAQTIHLLDALGSTSSNADSRLGKRYRIAKRRPLSLSPMRMFEPWR